MPYERLLREGRIRHHRTNPQEIASLFQVVERDLADAAITALSADRRFATAYNAALQAATAVMYSEGYRAHGTGHHSTTSEGAEPIMERWRGSDVTTNVEVQAQIAGFIQAHGVRQVAMTDGVIGCPHEEGIDFPEGQECPYCPFWRGKQGIRVKSEGRNP